MRASCRRCAWSVRRYWRPRFLGSAPIHPCEDALAVVATTIAQVVLVGACAVGAEAPATTAGATRAEDFDSAVLVVGVENTILAAPDFAALACVC
jgi:hypothetical protein